MRNATTNGLTTSRKPPAEGIANPKARKNPEVRVSITAPPNTASIDIYFISALSFFE
jgi:hypothetical protein